MLNVTAISGFGSKGGPGPYETDAVNMDGSNDYIQRSSSFTGGTGDTRISVVFWLNMGDSTDGENPYVCYIDNGGSQRFNFERNPTNKLGIAGRNSSGTTVLQTVTSFTLTESDGWTCIMFSKTGSTYHIYKNDTADTASAATNTSGNIDIMDADRATFAAFHNATQKFDGEWSDIWMEDAYIDFSVEANRRLFIDDTGKPVSLGDDGSTPTGNQPVLFFRRVPGESAASWAVNKGDGGAFTLSGTLTDSTQGSPTD